MTTIDQTDTVHAVVIEPDGTLSFQREPISGDSLSWAYERLGGRIVDTAPGYDRQLVLIVPDLMNGEFPWTRSAEHFNWTATALYGRSPMYGRVVVYRDDHQPLDPALVAALQGDHSALMRHTVTTHPDLPPDADQDEIDGYVVDYVQRLDMYGRLP